MASVFPAMPPSHVSVPRTTRAPGVSVCWPDAAKRHSFGISRRDVDLDLAAGGLLPQEAVGLGPGLAQLQEAGPHLVRLGRTRQPRARAGARQSAPSASSRAAPPEPLRRTAAPRPPCSGRASRSYISSIRCRRRAESELALDDAAGPRRARASAPPGARARRPGAARSPIATGPAQRPGSIFTTSSAKSSPNWRAMSLRVERSTSRGNIDGSPTSAGTSPPAADSFASSAFASRSVESPRRSGLRYTWRNATSGSVRNWSGCSSSQAWRSASVTGAASTLVLDQELELLPEAAPDDGVVPVQAQRHRFPGGQLVAHVVVHEPLQLVFGGRPLPGPRERGDHRVDLPGRDHDPVRRRTAAAPVRHREEQRAEREEVDERFAQPAPRSWTIWSESLARARHYASDRPHGAMGRWPCSTKG